MADAPIEVVTSAGELDAVVVLLREFLHRSGALRAVAAVDRGPDLTPAVVDCERFLPVVVDLGDRLVQIPHEAVLDVPAPELPDVRQQPPFEVDARAGAVTGAIGGLQHLASAVRALAAELGERGVAVATFETTDADAPLALSARAAGDEPVVVTIGDDSFELPSI